MTDRANIDLERASTLHFLALLFQPPTSASRDELRALATLLPEALRDAAASLLANAGDELEHEYHALLGGSGRCPDCESAYEVNALGGKGPLLADIAAFYAAFDYRAPATLCLAVDHVAIELDFLAYLAFKTAHARHGGLFEQAAICERASARFATDHLLVWLPAFLARLGDMAGDGFYGRAAYLTAHMLGDLAPPPVAAESLVEGTFDGAGG